MPDSNKNTVITAAISGICAVIVAAFTTYGTISVSKPKALEVKQELKEISDLTVIKNLPIGTITSSILTPSIFADAVGDPSVFDPKKSRWVLADGQKDVAVSRLGKIKGIRVTPDFRGMFIRGVNEGRDDGSQNPEDLNAGDYQPDAFQGHKHKVGQDPGANHYATSSSGWYGMAAPGAVAWKDAFSSGTYEDKNDGKEIKSVSETRPKNVSVYFYIKIN